MAALLVPASNPAVADTGGGNVNFVLTATLPTFPCKPPGCTNGTFTGSSNGALAGATSANVPWTVEWVLGTAANTGTGFSYVDSCDIPTGLAQGGGTLTATVGHVTGTYGTPAMGAPFPLPVVAVAATLAFEWTRIGVTALVITQVSVSITYATPSGTLTTIPVVTNHLGVALAAFAPLSAPPTCTAPGPITAVVVGSDQIAA
jgi:hypothetical protein